MSTKLDVTLGTMIAMCIAALPLAIIHNCILYSRPSVALAAGISSVLCMGIPFAAIALYCLLDVITD